MPAKKSGQEWAHVTEALKDRNPLAAGREEDEDAASNDSFRTADGAASVSSFVSANSRFSVVSSASGCKSGLDSPGRAGGSTPGGGTLTYRDAAVLSEIRAARAAAEGSDPSGRDSPPPPLMDYTAGEDEPDRPHGGFSCMSLLFSPCYFIHQVVQDMRGSKSKAQ